MSLWSRISNVFRGEHLNRDIEEEFEAHVAEAIAEGRDPEEARRALGAAMRQRQQSHDVRVIGWLDSLRADLVFGWRQLKRNKVTSAAAILSLAYRCAQPRNLDPSFPDFADWVSRKLCHRAPSACHTGKPWSFNQLRAA